MTNKKLQELREIILEANPKQGGRPFKFAPIGLSEVLMALEMKRVGFLITPWRDTYLSFNFSTPKYVKEFFWNLTKDLDQQDDSVIVNLLNLLQDRNGEVKNLKIHEPSSEPSKQEPNLADLMKRIEKLEEK